MWILVINIKKERERGRWEEKHTDTSVLFPRPPAEAEDFYASRYRSEPSQFVRSHEYKLPGRGDGGIVERLAAAQRHAWIKKGRAEWSFLPMRNYDDPVAAHTARKKSIDRPIWGDYYETVYRVEWRGPVAVWCSFSESVPFFTKNDR